MKSQHLVWAQLHLPRPLDPGLVFALLLTLASDRRSPHVVFETRSDQAGISHLIGCSRLVTSALRRMLTDHLPGVQLSKAATRFPASESGRLRVRPRYLPLRSESPHEYTRALLSALTTPLQQHETLVVQIVLGPRHPPRTLHPGVASPARPWWRAMLDGVQQASADERRLLQVRAADSSFDAVLRIGTHGVDRNRTRQLTLNIQSALATTRSPGTRMDFVREAPSRINDADSPRRWPLELTRQEMITLLAWPLGDEDYPGLPAKHPVPLRAHPRVHSCDRVFATSVAPGDHRQIGVNARDGLLHTVAYGPTNSGKSTVMLHLIEADMRAGRSVAVLDPKRQLVDDVLARVPRNRLDDVVILDVSHTTPIGFNPLDIHGRDPDVVVDGVMSVFAALFRDGFGPRTLDIFSGTLRTLTRAAAITGDQATLADIPRLLTDPGFRRSVLASVPNDEGLAGFWGWYDNQSPAAQSAAISAPLNKLRQLLLRPALMRMLDQRRGRFRLRDMFRRNAIVLVPLNEALIGSGTAELLGSLIVADLWQAVQERAAEKSPTRHPGFVYVDEAPRFLHLPTSLAEALALSRSMGVGWFLAAQFARQFPKELRTAVDMNARSKIVFATEFDDASHFARGSDHLSAADFMALARFQTYVNLAADGSPSGWALARTLPPSPTSIQPDAVIAHSQGRWATAPQVSEKPAQLNRTERSNTANPAQPFIGGQTGVGRKRRSP